MRLVKADESEFTQNYEPKNKSGNIVLGLLISGTGTDAIVNEQGNWSIHREANLVRKPKYRPFTEAEFKAVLHFAGQIQCVAGPGADRDAVRNGETTLTACDNGKASSLYCNYTFQYLCDNYVFASTRLPVGMPK